MTSRPLARGAALAPCGGSRVSLGRSVHVVARVSSSPDARSRERSRTDIDVVVSSSESLHAHVESRTSRDLKSRPLSALVNKRTR